MNFLTVAESINKIFYNYDYNILSFLHKLAESLGNFLTPLLADDYSYGLNLANNKLTGIIDIYNYQIWHYFNWGGRTIAHTFAQTLLMFPNTIFNIVNSIIYTCLFTWET